MCHHAARKLGENPTVDKKKKKKLPTSSIKREKKNDDAITATRSHMLKHRTHNGRPKFPLMVSSYITCKPRSGKHLLKTHPSAMRTATPALQPPPWKNFPQLPTRPLGPHAPLVTQACEGNKSGSSLLKQEQTLCCTETKRCQLGRRAN